MPKPRTPASILELKGAFKKNPARRRPPEPDGNGPIGDPPSRLSVDERKAWREVVRLAPARVLTGSDRLHVEQLARLMAEQWANGGDLPTTRAKRLDSLLAKIGMNPTDRSRLEVPPEPRGPNPFDSIDRPPDGSRS